MGKIISAELCSSCIARLSVCNNSKSMLHSLVERRKNLCELGRCVVCACAMNYLLRGEDTVSKIMGCINGTLHSPAMLHRPPRYVT